jgi:small membrane protein
MISIIQIILSIGVILVCYYSYRRLRSSYVDAIMIFLFMAAGLLFIFFPDLSTRVAHFLGVGRGADMIFYISILFFAFLIMKLYARTRKLEQMITRIIRDESIKNASSPDDAVNKTKEEDSSVE